MPKIYRIKTVQRLASLSEAAHPDTQFFIDLWRTKKGDRFAPAWSDIDWLEMRMSAVPRIMVVDVLRKPSDFRYRFFGTWHVYCHDRELTGRRVSDYEDEAYRDAVSGEYRAVVEERRPTLSRLAMTLHDIFYNSEILRLPLSDDAATVDRIMVVESLIGEDGQPAFPE